MSHSPRCLGLASDCSTPPYPVHICSQGRKKGALVFGGGMDAVERQAEGALRGAVRHRAHASGGIVSCIGAEAGVARGRQVSEMWTQATEMEKGPYEALSQIDRVRHQSEVEAYNYRCSFPPPTLSGGTPEPVWFACQLPTPVLIGVSFP